MKRKFSACVLAFMAVNIACLAVAEDAYVESSGVAGISTGYHLKPSTRIEVDFALTTLEQAQGARLFGADYNNAKLRHDSKTSSPMILAKCSHDMDILRWICGKKCVKLSSFGHLEILDIGITTEEP